LGLLTRGGLYAGERLQGHRTDRHVDAKAAIERASETLRDLRVAEVSELDIHLKDGKIESYRAKVRLSFKYEKGD
jgi:flavin-binding protein dodecin